MESQARLRGSVGGVQGILSIQQSVSKNITSPDSAIETLKEIYGFKKDVAARILGVVDEGQPTEETFDEDIDQGYNKLNMGASGVGVKNKNNV